MGSISIHTWSHLTKTYSRAYFWGFYAAPIKKCSCSASPIARYQKRISSPLLDRIDIHVEVPRVDYEKLADKRNACSGASPAPN